MRKTALVLVSVLLAAPAGAEVVMLEATHDATLIEDPLGEKANGSGSRLFVGRTDQSRNGIRRGLIRFDVAGALPGRAILESVRLTLHQSSSNPAPRTIHLHRVLAEWGEGPSAASGGGGAPAEPGDATWIHTFYDTDSWVREGGQFLGRASARLEVGDSGFYTWESSQHLLQDVRLWNAAPRQNFGWILIGDETASQSVKGFASRESPDLSRRPLLEIRYRLPADR